MLVVLFVDSAHKSGDVITLCWGCDQHLLGTSLQTIYIIQVSINQVSHGTAGGSKMVINIVYFGLLWLRIGLILHAPMSIISRVSATHL